MSNPAVSVVVASHGRPARLERLLDALADQIDCPPYEVVVVHDYPEAIAHAIFAAHPSTRQITIAAELARPSRQRNLGWRAARAPLVAFTDDDCRPAPDWLGALARRAAGQTGAIVQGRTRPDPEEAEYLDRPLFRSLHVDPPGRFTQTANILYPRSLLEQVGGFDERAITGEDIDLAIRSRATGAALVAAPDALVLHAVEPMTIASMIRSDLKWQHLVYVVKRHPELRDWCALRIFWELEHAYVLLAAIGLVGMWRQPRLSALLIPYYMIERKRRGTRLKDRLLALRQMPPRAIVELADVLIFACGSVRYRTFLL